MGMPDDFSAIVHDLNRVLMNVLGSADMIGRLLGPGHPAQAHVLELRDAVNAGRVAVQRLHGREERAAAAPSRGLCPPGEVVLVVEDDRPSLVAMERFLELAGYRVIGVGGFDGAIDAARAPLDLLVTDLGLGGGRGDALAERLRREMPDIPVLYVTGHDPDTSPDLKRALEQPRTAFVGKPVEAEALLAAIEALLELRRGSP
jgi:CheY-like chemotaxis protein